jgi:threonine synthase
MKFNPAKKGYFLETAHPVKFYDVVEPIIGQKIELPSTIQMMLGSSKTSIAMKADVKQLKEYLLTGFKR